MLYLQGHNARSSDSSDSEINATAAAAGDAVAETDAAPLELQAHEGAFTVLAAMHACTLH